MSIQNNEVHDNGKNALMLHRSCDYATIKNNTAYGNVDAGLAVYESSNCDISGNTFYHNKCEGSHPSCIYCGVSSIYNIIAVIC